jgi:carboxypeptidase T
MRRLLTLALLLWASIGFAQQPELYHRVKIEVGKDGLQKLAGAGIAVDHGTHKKGVYFITDLSTTEIEAVKQTGLSYTVLIEDMSKYYRERNEKKSGEKPTGPDGCVNCETYTTPINFQLGTMGGFYTYQEMLNILDSMKSKFPNLITVKQTVSSATTLQGRPLYFVKISDNPSAAESEPQVLYTALHHAREAESLSQLIFYMWYLLENYNTNAHIKYLVDNTEMYFIPCVNPDGYVYNQTTDPSGGGMWRKNRKNNGGSFGVDLNRNYGKFWAYDNIGSSPNGSNDTYRGTSAFSEPETQMVRDFCNTHQFKIALNAHTFSNLLIYPWGHVPSLLTPDSAAFQTFSHDMTECSGFIAGTGDVTVGYVTNGDSDDWMYGEQGTKPKIFAMTPEAGDQQDGFWPEVQRIIPIAKQTMDQNLDAAKLLTAYAEVKATNEPSMTAMNGYVTFDFKRTGLTNGTFTVSVVPLSTNITNVGAAKTFNNPTHLQQLKDSISIALNSGVNTNNVVKYVVKWQNSTGYTISDTVTRYYGASELAFYSNADDLDSFTTTSWAATTSEYVTATGSISDSPNGLYDGNATTTITTNGDIDLTDASAAYLTYYTRWEIEPGYDYVDIAASENNSTYNTLCGMYTKKGNENQNSTVAVYDGVQTTWVKEYIDLTDYLGKKIKLRFSLHSDQAVEMDGFYFDEFAVHRVIATVTPTGIDDVDVDDFSLSNVPNPCNNNTDIYYKVPASKQYSLLVTDLLGRTLIQKSVVPAKSHLSLDVSGLPSGVYFYKIVSASKGASAVKKMVVQH